MAWLDLVGMLGGSSPGPKSSAQITTLGPMGVPMTLRDDFDPKAPAEKLIAMARSTFRFVSSRIFSRVN